MKEDIFYIYNNHNTKQKQCIYQDYIEKWKKDTLKHIIKRVNENKLWESQSSCNNWNSREKYNKNIKPEEPVFKWVMGMKYDKTPPDEYLKVTKTTKEYWLK